MIILIGTLGYKKDNLYATSFPLFINNTQELKQAKQKINTIACDMFITDLLIYCTTASGLRAKKNACTN